MILILSSRLKHQQKNGAGLQTSAWLKCNRQKNYVLRDKTLLDTIYFHMLSGCNNRAIVFQGSSNVDLTTTLTGYDLKIGTNGFD